MRFTVIFLIGIQFAYAEKHSLRYFYTAVSGDINFPEYTSVGLVDDQQFTYFDSNQMRTVPKTEWIKQNVEADYWERQTQIGIGHHQSFKVNIQTLKDRFNQSKDVHTYQRMYGCQWDDQTGAKDGFNQYGYDGDDLVVQDFKEMRYVSPKQQGIVTQNKWNNNIGLLENNRNYFGTICIEWLQKYVQYGKNSLKKTVSPQVSLLQKSSSSPVVCHATGFYPSAIKISWQKNGQDHDEDVELGELLPNEDGSFQKTSTLNVKPEEWKNNKFRCVVEHQGETRAETEIRTNEDSLSIGLIVGVVAALVLLVVIAVAGYMVYQKKKGFKPVSGSDDGSNSSAHAVPQA
nr:major histocompatibility complex class I una [Danio rerio]